MRATRNTKQVTLRVAGAVGLLVGALAVLAGSRVLLGLSIPSYTVLRSLVLYNVFAGAISIVAGLGFWAGRYWAPSLAAVVAAAHVVVLILLVGFSALGESVASESFGAMTFRLVVWLGIVWLARLCSSTRRMHA